MPPSPGKIILLNGPSSSGKSTLAAALQAALPLPFWHFSIDHLIAAKILPTERTSRGDFSWDAMRPAFFEGFHNCLPALAAGGNNLVVEHIIETEAWRQRLLALLAPYDVFFVGLHCPLPELERREAARGDRKPGEARHDYHTTHALCCYDLELDSTLPAAQNAATLIAAWQARTRPSDFDRMRAIDQDRTIDQD